MENPLETDVEVTGALPKTADVVNGLLLKLNPMPLAVVVISLDVFGADDDETTGELYKASGDKGFDIIDGTTAGDDVPILEIATKLDIVVSGLLAPNWNPPIDGIACKTGVPVDVEATIVDN